MARSVFICHSVHDKQIADEACQALEARGISCWIAPRDVMAGMEWGKVIIDALSDCRVVLLIFSRSANDSPQVRREIERAVSKSKIIVPLRIEDVQPSDAMEYALGNTQWFDATTPPRGQRVLELCATIAVLTGGFDAPPQTASHKVDAPTLNRSTASPRETDPASPHETGASSGLALRLRDKLFLFRTASFVLFLISFGLNAIEMSGDKPLRGWQCAWVTLTLLPTAFNIHSWTTDTLSSTISNISLATAGLVNPLMLLTLVLPVRFRKACAYAILVLLANTARILVSPKGGLDAGYFLWTFSCIAFLLPLVLPRRWFEFLS
jgi:hypothetical protein